MTPAATQITHMAQEIAEIPQAARRLCTPQAQHQTAEAAALLRRLNAPCVLTLARGSSDHAATYLAYAIELTLRRPVVSVRPSLASVYSTALDVPGLPVLTMSQSGQSQDIRSMAQGLARGGAMVLALTNSSQSPLAQVATHTLAVHAGTETAVAATKSFVNTILAGLWLIAHWADDPELAEALRQAPAALDQALAVDVDALAGVMRDLDRTLVIARGPALGLAAEAALKLQETAAVMAIAYSGAEVLHGPSALAYGGGCAVIALGAAEDPGLTQARAELGTIGAQIRSVRPLPVTGHPLVDPLTMIVQIYRAAEVAARARGLSPDSPFHLRKETVTL